MRYFKNLLLKKIIFCFFLLFFIMPVGFGVFGVFNDVAVVYAVYEGTNATGTGTGNSKPSDGGSTVTAADLTFKDDKWDKLNKDGNGSIINKFHEAAVSGIKNTRPAVIALMGAFFVMQIGWGYVTKGLEDEDPFKKAVMLTLRFGVFWWLYNNWLAGDAICEKLFNSFGQLGAKAAGANMNLDAVSFIKAGWECSMKIMSALLGTSKAALVLSLPVACVGIVVFLIVILGFAYIAIQVFVLQVEMIITAFIGSVLFLFGVFDQTKHLALMAVKTAFNFAIKMMCFQFVLAIVKNIMEVQAEAINKVVSGSNGTLDFISKMFPEMICLTLVLLCSVFVIMKAPAIADGLISGSPGMSGRDLMNTISSATAAAVTAGSTMVAARAAAGGSGISQMGSGAGNAIGGAMKMLTGGKEGRAAGLQQMQAGLKTMGGGVAQAGKMAMETGKSALQQTKLGGNAIASLNANNGRGLLTNMAVAHVQGKMGTFNTAKESLSNFDGNINKKSTSANNTDNESRNTIGGMDIPFHQPGDESKKKSRPTAKDIGTPSRENGESARNLAKMAESTVRMNEKPKEKERERTCGFDFDL